MISVIIPLYNKARFVSRALESVLRQTFADFECILVDDGSTDGSGEIVAGIKDARIRLVRQANGGVSRARNRGIELARHPLIAFLDADDEWLPCFLAESLKLHRQHPEIVASFANYRRDGASQAAFADNGCGARVLSDYFAFCLSHNGLGMWTSTVMAHRDILLKIGGFPPGRKMGEDLDTWARLAWSGPIGFLPAELTAYHDQAGVCVQTAKFRPAQKWERLHDISDTHQQWIHGGLVAPAIARSSAELVCFLQLLDFYEAIRSGHDQQARLLYAKVPRRSRWSVMGLCGYVALRLRHFHRLWLGLGRRIELGLLARRWGQHC